MCLYYKLQWRLKFSNIEIIAVGNELRYYNNSIKSIITTEQICPTKLHDKIHGIAVISQTEDLHKIVVYGGKEFALFIIEKVVKKWPILFARGFVIVNACGQRVHFCIRYLHSFWSKKYSHAFVNPFILNFIMYYIPTNN